MRRQCWQGCTGTQYWYKKKTAGRCLSEVSSVCVEHLWWCQNKRCLGFCLNWGVCMCCVCVCVVCVCVCVVCVSIQYTQMKVLTKQYDVRNTGQHFVQMNSVSNLFELNESPQKMNKWPKPKMLSKLSNKVNLAQSAHTHKTSPQVPYKWSLLHTCWCKKSRQLKKWKGHFHVI